MWLRSQQTKKTIQGKEKMFTFQIVKIKDGTKEVVPVKPITADSNRDAKEAFYKEVVATGITETYQLHDDSGRVIATEGPEVFSMFA